MSYKNVVSTEPEIDSSFIETKSLEYVKRWQESEQLEQRASKLLLDFVERYKMDDDGAINKIAFIKNKLKYYNDQLSLANRVRRELKSFEDYHKQLKKQ